jgi:hypothetical protein
MRTEDVTNVVVEELASVDIEVCAFGVDTTPKSERSVSGESGSFDPCRRVDDVTQRAASSPVRSRSVTDRVRSEDDDVLPTFVPREM